MMGCRGSPIHYDDLVGDHPIGAQGSEAASWRKGHLSSDLEVQEELARSLRRVRNVFEGALGTDQHQHNPRGKRKHDIFRQLKEIECD